MRSSVVPLPQDFIQVNGLRPQASPQVSCVANEVDDALAVHSFSRRDCSYRESLVWSESHEEHDFLGGDLATGNLWTGLVFLQPASVLLLRGKHFQVKPRLVLHDKLVAERVHTFSEEQATNMLRTVDTSLLVDVSQVVRDPNGAHVAQFQILSKNTMHCALALIQNRCQLPNSDSAVIFDLFFNNVNHFRSPRSSWSACITLIVAFGVLWCRIFLEVAEPTKNRGSTRCSLTMSILQLRKASTGADFQLETS